MVSSGVLSLSVLDDSGKPLSQQIRIELHHRRLRSERKFASNVDASRKIEIQGLRAAPDGIYTLEITARNRRPHHQFLNIRASGKTEVEVVLQPAVSPKEEADVLQRAMDYSITHVVDRYATEHGLPREVAAEQARELKRFLAVATITAERYALFGPVAELWKTFVIFTRDYQRFGENVAGRFLYLRPSVKPGSAGSPFDPETAYGQFLSDYKTIIGEEPPAHIWRTTIPDNAFWYWIVDGFTSDTGTTETTEMGTTTTAGDGEGDGGTTGGRG